MNDDEIEVAISKKGLTAPRVTPAKINDCISKREFHVFGGTSLTVCCLTLSNGFTVTGESACASPSNYDRGIGEDIAFSNAREKIWALEGYLLRQKLYEESQ